MACRILITDTTGRCWEPRAGHITITEPKRPIMIERGVLDTVLSEPVTAELVLEARRIPDWVEAYEAVGGRLQIVSDTHVSFVNADIRLICGQGGSVESVVVELGQPFNVSYVVPAVRTRYFDLGAVW